MMHTITPLNSKSKSILSKIYKESLFLPSQRKSYNGNNEVNDWALDLRYALAKSRFLAPVTDELIKVIEEENITQIVGRGYGSFFLMGAIVAKKSNVRAGLIRYSQKPYGFRRLIEGDLRPNRRTLIIDDVIGSGENVKQTIEILKQNYINVCGALFVFRFGWKEIPKFQGEMKIIALGVLNYK